MRRNEGGRENGMAGASSSSRMQMGRGATKKKRRKIDGRRRRRGKEGAICVMSSPFIRR
jgi:hypothetical protein